MNKDLASPQQRTSSFNFLRRYEHLDGATHAQPCVRIDCEEAGIEEE